MKYLFIALLALTTTSAHAQMSEGTVKQFLQKHIAAFASCNPQTLKTHMDKHFAPSFTLTAQSPEGESRTASKADMMQAFTQIPDDFDFSQLSAEDCAPKFTVSGLTVNGPNAQFVTLEQTQFTDENGQNKTASLTCTNNATLQNNNVIITKSNCVASIQ